MAGEGDAGGVWGAHLAQQVSVVLHQLTVLLLQFAVPLLIGLCPSCHTCRDTELSTRAPCLETIPIPRWCWHSLLTLNFCQAPLSLLCVLTLLLQLLQLCTQELALILCLLLQVLLLSQLSLQLTGTAT